MTGEKKVMEKMDAMQIGGIAYAVSRFIIENRRELERIAQSIEGCDDPAKVIAGVLDAGKDTVLAMLDFIDEYGDSDADN